MQQRKIRWNMNIHVGQSSQFWPGCVATHTYSCLDDRKILTFGRILIERRSSSRWLLHHVTYSLAGYKPSCNQKPRNLLFQTRPRSRIFEGNCARTNTSVVIARLSLSAYIKFPAEVFRPCFCRTSPCIIASLAFPIFENLSRNNLTKCRCTLCPTSPVSPRCQVYFTN